MSIELVAYNPETSTQTLVAVRFSRPKGNYAVQMCVPLKNLFKIMHLPTLNTLEEDGFYPTKTRISLVSEHLGFWVEKAEFVDWSYVENVPDRI